MGDGAGTAATFTAPVTGIYSLSVTVLMQSLVSTTNGATLTITTTNRTYNLGDHAVPTATGNYPLTFTVLADMTATNTATFSVNASGGTKIVDIYGGADSRTFCSGILLA